MTPKPTTPEWHELQGQVLVLRRSLASTKGQVTKLKAERDELRVAARRYDTVIQSKNAIITTVNENSRRDSTRINQLADQVRPLIRWPRFRRKPTNTIHPTGTTSGTVTPTITFKT